MLTNVGLLILRVSVGLTMMLAHGYPKLANFGAYSQKFPALFGMPSSFNLGLAVFSEFFCSLFLILGLFTRWVSIPLLITMLVAWFVVHGGDPWKKQELAAMYTFAYAALACLGGGDFGLDRFIRKK